MIPTGEVRQVRVGLKLSPDALWSRRHDTCGPHRIHHMVSPRLPIHRAGMVTSNPVNGVFIHRYDRVHAIRPVTRGSLHLKPSEFGETWRSRSPGRRPQHERTSDSTPLPRENQRQTRPNGTRSGWLHPPVGTMGSPKLQAKMQAADTARSCPDMERRMARFSHGRNRP